MLVEIDDEDLDRIAGQDGGGSSSSSSEEDDCKIPFQFLQSSKTSFFSANYSWKSLEHSCTKTETIG